MSVQRSMLKALVGSILVIVAACFIWFVMTVTGFMSGPANLGLRALPLVAAVPMGYFAPRKPIMNGVLLGVVVAMAFGIVNLIDEHLGDFRNFPGFSGVITVMILFLPFSLPVSALGALIGTRLAERKAVKTDSTES